MSNWKTLEAFEAELMRDPGFRDSHEGQQSEYAVAREILQARLASGLSQKALADAIGTSQGRVSKWERAEEEPRIEALRRIAVATGRVLVVGLFDEETRTARQRRSGAGTRLASKRTTRKTIRSGSSVRKSTGRKKVAAKVKTGKSTIKSASRKSSAKSAAAKKTAAKSTARRTHGRKTAGRRASTHKGTRTAKSDSQSDCPSGLGRPEVSPRPSSAPVCRH